MRGLLCSSLIVILASGCTTLTGSRLRRGELQATRELSTEHRDEYVVQVNDADEASVRRDRRTCTVLERSYSQARVDELSTTTVDMPFLTALMIGGGAAAMIYAATLPEEDELRLPLVLVGVSVGGGGLLGWLAGDMTSTSTSTTTTPVDSVETEKVPDCKSTSVTLREALPWRLTVGPQSRSGVTGPDGRLSTAPVIYELLAQVVEDEAELRRFVTGKALRYSLTLGKAPPTSGALSTRNLPDSFFDAAAQWYEQRLSGEARERWENCKLIAKSSLERFECLWQ